MSSRLVAAALLPFAVVTFAEPRADEPSAAAIVVAQLQDEERIDRLRERNRELRQRNLTLEERIDELRGRIETLRDARDSAGNNQVTELRNRLQRARTRVDEVERNLNQCETRVSTLEQTRDDFRERTEQLEGTIAVLEGELQERGVRLEDVRSSGERNTEYAVNLRQNLRDCTAALDRIRQERDDLAELATRRAFEKGAKAELAVQRNLTAEQLRNELIAASQDLGRAQALIEQQERTIQRLRGRLRRAGAY